MKIPSLRLELPEPSPPPRPLKHHLRFATGLGHHHGVGVGTGVGIGEHGDVASCSASGRATIVAGSLVCICAHGYTGSSCQFLVTTTSAPTVPPTSSNPTQGSEGPDQTGTQTDNRNPGQFLVTTHHHQRANGAAHVVQPRARLRRSRPDRYIDRQPWR